eukprot:10477776-Lingulodinium_polyedra.AAC.1
MAAALAPGAGSCPCKVPQEPGKTARQRAECKICAYEDVPLQTHTRTECRQSTRRHAAYRRTPTA